MITARTYTAKYRDGSGIVQEVATGCRDESAARSVLGRTGTAGRKGEGRRFSPLPKTAMIDHQDTPLAEHFAAFLEHQKAEGN